MAKTPELSDITNVLTSATTHNSNNDKIIASFENTLSRDGSTPNQMGADIDMDSNDLLNVQDAHILRTLTVQGVDILEAISNDVDGGTIYNTINRFQGDGSTTTFTLTTTPTGASNVFVYISGVHQQHNTWSLATNVLTFSEAPAYATETNIEVVIQEELESASLGTDAPVLTPTLFGAVGDGVANDTVAVRACYSYANPLRRPVAFYDMEACLIDADAQIQVRVPTDGAGCHLKAANGLVATPASGTVNTMFIIEDGATPLVTGNVATPAADGTKVADLSAGSTRACGDFMQDAGFAYFQGSGGTGPNIVDRYEAGVSPYRQSFAIGVNGRSLQPLSLDVSTETQLYYETRAMPSSGNLRFQNFNVDLSTFNNQEIVRISRCNTSVSNIQFMQEDGTADPDTINRLIKVYKAAYVYINEITAHAQQDGGDGGGTYVYNYENFAEVYMDRCHGTDGWGAMGTNHGNGLYVTNCNLNRVDFHNGGHNYFVSNSTIYNRGIFLGWGGGSLKVTDCKFIDAPVIQYRADYGGIFWGDIIVDGVEGVDAGFVWTIVDANTNPVGSSVLSGPVARSIVVRNAHRSDADENGNNREIIPVHITVDPTSGTLAPIAPTNIQVDNVSCSGNWRVQCYVDYQNMVLAPDTDNCTWNFTNVKATRANFTGNGIHIPTQYAGAAAGVGDYRIQLRVSDSTKISINVDEHPKVDVYCYDNDLCRINTPAGADVEIDGGVMEDPDLQDAETHVVVGNSRSGVGYTTVRNVKVQGIDASSGWDFSNVETLIGVDIPDVATNDGVILPTGCQPAHAFYGWRKDDPTGEITPDFWGRNTNPGVTDMTAAIEAAAEYAADNGQTLHFKNNYGFTNLNPTLRGDEVYWQFDQGSKLTQLSTRTAGDPAVSFDALQVAAGRSVTTSAASNDLTVTLDDASNFEEGRIVTLTTNLLHEGDHRFLASHCVQQTLRVASVSGNNVTFDDPLIWDMDVGTLETGTAQAGASDQITLKATSTVTRDEIRHRQITITGGTGSGQTRYIHDYDASTKVVTLGITKYGGGTDFDQDDWVTVPDATSTYEIVSTVTAACWDTLRTPRINGMKVYGYEEDSVNVYGVIMGYADRPLIEDCYIEGCSNMSLYTYWCYKPVVRNNHFKGANYAYSTGSGRGYGHEDYGSYLPIITGNTAEYCRTGFDLVQGSYGARRTSNHVIGGGKTYAGVDFHPAGAEPNSGMSSHTSAVNVYDSGNLSHNVYQNKIRGTHTVSGDRLSGLVNRGYLVYYTKRANIIGVTYDNDYTYMPRVTNGDFNTGDDGPLYPDVEPTFPTTLVLIQQDDMVEKGSVIIRDCVLHGLREDLVQIGSQSTSSDLYLEVVNNSVTVVKPTGAGDVSLIDSASDLSLGKLVCYGNTLNWGGSAAGAVAYDNFSPLPVLDVLEPSDNVAIVGEGTFAVRLEDDDARVTFPVGNNRGGFFARVYRNDDVANFHWYGLIDSSTGVVHTIASTGTTFAAYDTAIGPTSSADGNMILSMRSNNNLQMVNRTGAEATFIVETGAAL